MTTVVYSNYECSPGVDEDTGGIVFGPVWDRTAGGFTTLEAIATFADLPVEQVRADFAEAFVYDQECMSR